MHLMMSGHVLSALFRGVDIRKLVVDLVVTVAVKFREGCYALDGIPND
jgi:hypothetical protein